MVNSVLDVDLVAHVHDHLCVLIKYENKHAF